MNKKTVDLLYKKSFEFAWRAETKRQLRNTHYVDRTEEFMKEIVEDINDCDEAMWMYDEMIEEQKEMARRAQIHKDTEMNRIREITAIVDDLLKRDYLEKKDEFLIKEHGQLFIDNCERNIPPDERITIYAYAIEEVYRYSEQVKGTKLEKIAHHWLGKLKERQIKLYNETHEGKIKTDLTRIYDAFERLLHGINDCHSEHEALLWHIDRFNATINKLTLDKQKRYLLLAHLECNKLLKIAVLWGREKLREIGVINAWLERILENLNRIKS